MLCASTISAITLSASAFSFDNSEGLNGSGGGSDLGDVSVDPPDTGGVGVFADDEEGEFSWVLAMVGTPLGEPAGGIAFVPVFDEESGSVFFADWLARIPQKATAPSASRTIKPKRSLARPLLDSS